MFAIRQIEVEGASPEVAARVKAALRPLAGSSLVSFDRGRAAGRLTELPEVAGATYDRAFPHTLKVIVRVERPAAVLRRGGEAWLVAGSGRILRQLAGRPYPPLPRIWVPLSFDVGAGETLAGDPLSAVRALGSLGHVALPAHVRSVRAGDGGLTFVLASGLELRLGNATDLALKLAVAAQVLPRAGTASYLDVSVPERTVVGPPLSQNSQVEG